MVQLYQKLHNGNPFMMPDTEFAKHLITLMLQSDEWHYCHDSLCDKVCQGETMGRAILSTVVLQHLKHEEVEMKITPSIVSIDVLATKRGRAIRDVGDSVVPSSYATAAGSSNQNSCQNEKTYQ